VQTAVGKVMTSLFYYHEGTLLVDFRAMCEDVTRYIITDWKCSAKQ
jgi:hypothetical protein